MRVAFATLGCKVNHYETQAMQELFEKAGWTVTPFQDAADAYVINTCTVTQTSDGKSRQMISRAHKANPDAVIAVVGCYAQVDPAAVAALPGVDVVIGTDGRKQIVEAVTAALHGQPADAQTGGNGEIIPQHTRTFENLSAVRDGRTRATLKIQDGCVNYCTYCIIPYARGPLRSRPLEDIRRELTTLAEEGYREVVLTGIHLASYGRDLGDCALLDVLALTREIDGLARVRLGSLEPRYVDERFAQAAAENPKICRQFHLSLQSGSDTVLARMKRKYDTREYAGSVALLRSAMPDCAVTTDVIAGFCGETEQEHRESMAFCQQMAFARMHVFPFSVRRGTKAAEMEGQLPQALKEERARELIALGKRLTDQFLKSQLGTEQTVLVERNGRGYTGNYIHVQTTGREGELLRVVLTEIEQETVVGKELNE